MDPQSATFRSEHFKALIVDDSRVIRLILKDMLQNLGLEEVLEAEDGETALKVFEKSDPELIFLDLYLPGIGGQEIARRVLSVDPHTKIVIISSEHRESQIVRSLISLGIFDFIGKPLKEDAVLSVVSRMKNEGRLGQNQSKQSSSTSLEEIPHAVIFDHDDASKSFRFLAVAFLQDYTVHKIFVDTAGWRTVSDIAKGTTLPISKLYGKSGEPGVALAELLRRGLAEARWLSGQRGRGGTTMKVRVNYGNPYVKGELDRLALQP